MQPRRVTCWQLGLPVLRDNISIDVQIPPHLFIAPSVYGAITPGIRIKNPVHTRRLVVIVDYVEDLLGKRNDLYNYLSKTLENIPRNLHQYFA